MQAAAHAVPLSRRSFLKQAALTASALALAPTPTLLPRPGAGASHAPLRVGLLLPSSTLYPALATSLRAGVELALGQARGVALQVVTAGSGFGPAALEAGARQLLTQGATLVLGLANEGLMATLVPLFERHRATFVACNVGADYAPALLSPFYLHHSLGYWQAAQALGAWAVPALGPRAFVAASFYDSGYDALHAFRQGLEAAGGQVVGTHVSHVRPDDDGLAQLAPHIQAARPDFVFALYTGQTGTGFLRAFARAGLLDRLPLVGSAFFVDEALLPSYGSVAVGVRSAFSWSPALATAENRAFTSAFQRWTGRPADVGAWLGYSAAQRVVRALHATGTGSVGQPAFQQAMAAAHRAPTLYLREVRVGKSGLANQVVGTLPLPAVAPALSSLRSGWLNAYLAA